MRALAKPSRGSLELQAAKADRVDDRNSPDAFALRIGQRRVESEFDRRVGVGGDESGRAAGIWQTNVAERLRQRMEAVLVDVLDDAIAVVWQALRIPDDRHLPLHFGQRRGHRLRSGRLFSGKRPAGSSINTQAIPAFSA